MAKPKQTAEFVKWMGPILDVLRQLGGSGTPKEVVEGIIESLQIPEAKVEEKLKSGMPRFHNQVYWARQYLVWEGFLDSTKKGIWTLTPAAQNLTLSEEESRVIFLKWVKIYADRRKNKITSETKDYKNIEEIDIDESTSEKENHRQGLIRILRSMSYQNFEKFSLLLLRENDFEDLKLTGGSKDEGIDGMGILRINPFVSFRVMFQCKKYGEKNSVSRVHIADFRNAMLGRADKGIFITTSYFTKDAEKEASREGVPPVELVDADKLIEMIEKTELGVKPITTFEIDHDFFKSYL
jgi:restriction system protein